jgi:hypothetical protein
MPKFDVHHSILFMDKTELEHYFNMDKSSWCQIDGTGKKIWGEKKVKEFWSLLRENITNKGKFHFANICFPEFEYLPPFFGDDKLLEEDNNFWLKGDKITFESDVSFVSCKFQGNANFGNVTFSEEVDFHSCHFEESVDFGFSSFFGYLRIHFCEFHDELKMNSSSVYGDFKTGISKFHGKVTFSRSTFHKYTLFEHSSFDKEVNYSYVKFGELFEQEYVKFYGEVMFHESQIYELNFNSISFKNKFTFQHIVFINTGKFNGISFSNTEKTTFEKIQALDVDKVTLEEYERIKYLFSSYKLISNTSVKINRFAGKVEEKKTIEEHIKGLLENESLKRFFEPLSVLTATELKSKVLMVMRNKYSKGPVLFFNFMDFNVLTFFNESNLSNTSFMKSDISEIRFRDCRFQIKGRLILPDEARTDEGDIPQLETLYRQLKKSFEREKNWELMDYSYASEMKMKQKTLLKRNEYFSWSVYKFYEIFAAYTQNFIRPLTWFVFLTFLIFPMVYFVLEISCNMEGSFISFVQDTILNCLQNSVGASIPFISSSLKNDFWWIQSFQTIFSAILLTFFVLALRRRFRF